MTELLADRYELLERIGAGGMAEVFRARMVGPAGFQKVVALKRILEDLCADQDFLSRFIDEARLTARLQHPNICQVLDFGSIDGRYFITMEYIDGLDLSKVLLKLEQRGEVLTPDLCLSITAGVLRGLSHAHGAADDDGRRLGLVHRDVSPQNVLLSINGDIKLSDFGVAKADALVRQARTMENVALGKLAYMAPEQRRGGKVDERTDVFGTGILLIEMLQGPAAMRRNAGSLNMDMERVVAAAVETFPRDLAARIAGVIDRAVEQKPERRYSDAISMLSEIEQFSRELGLGSAGDRLGDLVRGLQDSRVSKSGGRPGNRSEEHADLEALGRREVVGPPLTRQAPVSEDLATRVRRGAPGIEAQATNVHRGVGSGGSALEAIETRILSNRGTPPDELTTQVRHNVTRPLETEDILLESVSSELSFRGSSLTASRSRGISDLIDSGTGESLPRGQDATPQGQREPRRPVSSSRVGPQAPPSLPREADPTPSASDLLRADGPTSGPTTRPRSAAGPTPGSSAVDPSGDQRSAWPGDPVPAPSASEPVPVFHDEHLSPIPPRRPPARWATRQGTGQVHQSTSGAMHAAFAPVDGAPSSQASTPAPAEAADSTVRVRVGNSGNAGPLFWGGIVAIATMVTLVAVGVGWSMGWHRSASPPAGAEALIGVSPMSDASVGEGDSASAEAPPPGAVDASSGADTTAGGSSTADGPAASLAGAGAPPRPRPPVQPGETPSRNDPQQPQKRANGPPQSPGPGRGQARVSIYSDPPGVAYVDGRLVGPRTPVRGVEVSPGRHEIRVVFSSTRQEARRVVTVGPGGHEVVWLRDER